MSDQPGVLRKLDETGIPMLLARLALGGLFIYMGYNKATQPTDFLQAVRLYQMVPEHPPYLLNFIAATLPWVEIFCGVLLVVGVALRGNALLLLTMLIGFTIGVTLRAMEIHRAEGTPFCAIYFDCGCGTGVEWICGKIVKNIGLCILASIVLLSRSRWLCLQVNLRRR